MLPTYIDPARRTSSTMLVIRRFSTSSGRYAGTAQFLLAQGKTRSPIPAVVVSLLCSALARSCSPPHLADLLVSRSTLPGNRPMHIREGLLHTTTTHDMFVSLGVFFRRIVVFDSLRFDVLRCRKSTFTRRVTCSTGRVSPQLDVSSGLRRDLKFRGRTKRFGTRGTSSTLKFCTLHEQ